MGTNNVTFEYAILGDEQNTIVPCLGREQPTKHYAININLKKNYTSIVKGGFIAGISLLGLGIIVDGTHQLKQRRVLPDKTFIAIGNYKFFHNEQLLNIGDKKIDLTAKESKLLYLFAINPNQTIDRNQLQKVWEDEGVIVGRSLDMFISKLRKKLENDTSVNIVNIHNKGYKLEVEQGII